MKRRRKTAVRITLCLCTMALILWAACRTRSHTATVPGLQDRERTLLRIWLINAPGGGEAWLTGQLRAFEKQHPGVMTHLRVVSPAELTAEDTVLPDVVLFMPGDVTDPEAFFTPIPGDWPLREALLSAGQRNGQQYALPLCWGAWVMAIDSTLDPVPAATPAPTTLLGRPAAPDAPTAAPGYPLDAASAHNIPLQSPGGAALLTLCSILPPEERPPCPADLGQHTSAEVYAEFRARRCATAMLTTGQVTALSALTSAGKGFPFRTIVPDGIVTDQVMMAALTEGAPPVAAELLRFLTDTPAQQALTAQTLHTVRDDLTLYAAGLPREVEDASSASLATVNAFLSDDAVGAAAWQAFSGTLPLHQAITALQ